MQNNEYDNLKEMLNRSEDLYSQLCSDLMVFGSDGNEHRITISGSHKNNSGFSYGIPDYLLNVIRDAIAFYVSELKEKLEYYYRHSCWINADTIYGYNCVHCGCFNPSKTKYCPNCGVKMDIQFKTYEAKKLYEIMAKKRLSKHDTKDE